MNPVAVLLIALAMSTDAFAAAVGKGIALHRPQWSEALRTGLIFGVIEAVTPVLGWAIGSVAAGFVQAIDHWIAFTLLGLLGLRMVVAAWRESDEPVAATRPSRHGFWVLAVTGFATSIDAMVVGAGLAFVDVGIVPIAIAIGLTTFVAVTCGVMLGRLLGPLAGRWAEAAGGLVLIGIGTAILVEHLSGSA
ncbi:MAG: manganese efflux pump MntP family protein [Pseudomonadota bacterium]|nr:manganese efflux pump MntP family protein [Pseudomonadota bacterium]